MSVHVVPRQDEREHVLTCGCWCEPRVQWVDEETGMPHEHGEPIVVHFAADCRECGEIDGESVEEGKDWEIVRDVAFRS